MERIHAASRSEQRRESLQYFTEMVRQSSETREDIKTWADVLDLDDYVTFGGKP